MKNLDELFKSMMLGINDMIADRDERTPHTRYEGICEAGFDVANELTEKGLITYDTFVSVMAMLPVICVEADNRYDNEYYENRLKPWILDTCRNMTEQEAHDITFRHVKDEYGDYPVDYILGLADHLIGYRHER